ncbi:hypothetical protein [Geomonas anaerohicana]|uniref:Oligosaccharide repeat unit polymerase n=1 Tax=Geomonas anaerohicana TaxID=2798583 RepID=A0ABS0YBK7_9BACT|nr:hypothetical protein [Geomonas anaerohicana]MBJ6749693.1 hypothetical protein [Geomonas anaerohicana]
MDERVLGSAEWLPMRFAGGLLIALLGGISLAIAGSRRTTPSTLFLTFQLAFVHLPSCALCAVHRGLPLWFTLMTACLLTLMGLSVRRIAAWLNIGYPVLLRVLVAIPLAGWVAYAAIIYTLAILQNKLSFASVFNLEILYDFRAEVFSNFDQRALTALGALGYFCFPLLMIFALRNKSWLSMMLLLVLVVLLYGLTGMKAYLAVPVFTVVTFYMSQKYQSASFLSHFLLLLMIFFACAALLGFYLNSPWPLALFFSRGAVTPGELHIIYGDYFADTARLPIWQILRKVMPGGGELNWAELITKEIFGGNVGQGEGANTGMIASSFAVYGLLGVAFHFLVMLVVLALLDRFALRDRHFWIAYAAIPSLFLLTNMELISNLIYYGLGFSLMLTVCMTSRERRGQSRLDGPIEFSGA